MGLSLADLTDGTRRYMVEEVDADIQEGTLYLSPRLTSDGLRQYPELLRDACARHDDDWLAGELQARGLMRLTEERRMKSGTTMVKVPVTAPTTLAEGEFNRYYLRGLARLAIENGVPGVEVYRAKPVERPRAESEVLIGRIFDARKLLVDIRSSGGFDTLLGLPPGPNSGLSARLPRSGR